MAMNNKRRISLEPPQRSNPTSPDTSLLIDEKSEISTREECIELCYRMDTFSDVTFRVGNSTTGPFKVYKLHRLVLGGQSPYLYNLCVKAVDSTEMVDLPDVPPYIFDHIVKWLYKAKLTDKTADMAVIAKVYEIATKLKIRELESKALETLTTILAREKEKENQGGVSILDGMLRKASDDPLDITTPTLEQVSPTIPVGVSITRSNTAGSASTNRRESKTLDFFKGVIEKVSNNTKGAGVHKGTEITATASIFGPSLLHRAKNTIRGRDRAVTHPANPIMISKPFNASRITPSGVFAMEVGTLPPHTSVRSEEGAPTRDSNEPGTPRGSKRGTAYRNSSAF